MVVDTSIFIEFLRLKNKKTARLYEAMGSNTLYVSTVTFFELYTGATTAEKTQEIDILLENVIELPFSKGIALLAAENWLELRKKNQQIEIRDLFIGCTALSYNLSVFTLNKKHFTRIPGLEVIQ